MSVSAATPAVAAAEAAAAATSLQGPSLFKGSTSPYVPPPTLGDKSENSILHSGRDRAKDNAAAAAAAAAGGAAPPAASAACARLGKCCSRGTKAADPKHKTQTLNPKP